MIIAANWKMNMGFHKAVEFLASFNSLVGSEDKENFIFFPPACLSGLFHKENFYWGGQNIYYKAEGSCTGENSAKALREMGARFCLLGHSERRWTFGESDVDVEKKFSLLQELALIPVLCVGESLSDRFDREKILKRQLSWIKDYKKYEKLPWKPELLPKFFKDISLIVAYEPVWSIGTGDTPSVQELNETAHFIKDYLHLHSIKTFYGGSIDEKTVKNFSKCSYIDGFLVGGASLSAQGFYSIYEQCL